MFTKFLKLTKNKNSLFIFKRNLFSNADPNKNNPENSKENTKNKKTIIYLTLNKFNIMPDTQLTIEKKQESVDTNKVKYTKESHNYALNKMTIGKVLKASFYQVFLPRDYPHSVKSDYLNFSKYQFLAAICAFTMNFLSTQVLINSLGLGVSKTVSYGISAGLNWVLKDSIGQLCKFFLFKASS